MIKGATPDPLALLSGFLRVKYFPVSVCCGSGSFFLRFAAEIKHIKFDYPLGTH